MPDFRCAVRLKGGKKHVVDISDAYSIEECRVAIKEHMPTAKTILVLVPKDHVPVFHMEPQTA